MPSEHKELISIVGSLCPVEHLVSSFLKKKDIRELGILCSLYALAFFLPSSNRGHFLLLWFWN